VSALERTPAFSVGYNPLRDARHKTARAARECADWLAWLELGNKATRTLDSYERYVAVLLRAWPTTPFDEFDDGHLAHVLKQFPPRSRHIVKAAWNNWFRWGHRTRRISGNPVDLLPVISYKPNRAYDIFTDPEADALCALPSPDGELMMILFEAGLRRAEARRLTGKRIDFNRDQIVVMEGAKGGKSRQVPMIARLETACAELVTLEGIGRDDHVWGSRPGGSRRVKRNTPIADTTFDNWWARRPRGRRCTEAEPAHEPTHMRDPVAKTRPGDGRDPGAPRPRVDQHHLGHLRPDQPRVDRRPHARARRGPGLIGVISVTTLHAPATFESWLRTYHLTVEVKERDVDTVTRLHIPPWYAVLRPPVETLSGGFATSRHGSGKNPEAAVADLMRELRGRRMRRLGDGVGSEFYAPTSWDPL
jgi:integrase